MTQPKRYRGGQLAHYLLPLVPLEHSPDRRPLSQVLPHGRQGGQAAGLAYLFDCEPGERIRARLAARSGQQFGVLDEAERIPRGSNRTRARSRTGASFAAARSQFKMSYQARFPMGESARSLNRGAPEALDV